ncbi:MAG TPA: amidohydrolase family protein, partial [Planctomycetota bacterium]|nr:amidohydrolase family protein [Planctomycetota bacterium]
MRASRHLLALATAAMALPAQAPAPATAAAFAVHCGRLLTGDATLTDAWLVVRDGKVVSVGTDAPPADLPVVDAEGKVVMPGIVAADSDLSGAADAEYNVTPDFVAADGFDFDRNYRDALMGGVTTAYLSPGRERLISGQGSVVKLAGTDVVQRVLKDAACLRINVGDGAVLAPRVFEPTPHPTADDPLLPARIQKPTARIGVLAELRALFGRGTDQDQHLAGQGSGENKYDKSALAAVVQGRLPLRAAATKAQDVRRALELAHELGCRLVLENPQEIGALAAQAGAQKAMATFRLPALPGMPNPGGEDRRQKRPEPTFTAAAKAAAAGMTIAVGPPVGMPLRDFMLAAALAVRGGLGREQALRAITIDAARVLGVDDHVGSLAAGKDGDFVILSGEPLAVGTMVETTYIDGKIAFQRKTGAGQLAVRCGRIHDAEGHVFRNGVILVADGKVRGVGEDLAIPYGARVIDVPSGVMTPGLIDAFSHLGLAGDGTPVPPGAANQRLADAIDPADPMFAPALAAGLTTVLVSGKDSGLQSGRVTAVKTGSKDAATAVVRAIAGQRLVFDAIGPDATKPLKELLDRGKQYSKTWHDYDKALADYKAGKTAPKPAAAAKPAEAPPPAKDDPIGGTWEGEITQGR